MSKQKKAISMLLYEGSLDGVFCIEDTSWSGELYSAPRASVSDLLQTGACNKFGVYLLLSPDKVYIGQSSDLAKRITQHTMGKDWWERVVILTTKDDGLTLTDINYLEYVLIEKAFSISGLDCENKKKGNQPKVDKFHKVPLDQYLSEAMFLLDLIGITVFSEKDPRKTKRVVSPSAISVDAKSKLSSATRMKAEAIAYIEKQGLRLGKTVCYAKKNETESYYWANPLVKYLASDLWIILNDNVNMILTVLKIPANTLNIQEATFPGLSVRKSEPHKLNIKIDADSLCDIVSKTDFSPFVIKKFPY